jgi:hypothetical protein
MASTGYYAWAVTAGEQPTTAYWNILGTNDASFNSGAGFNDGLIVYRHVGKDSSWAWQSWTPIITGSNFVASTMTAQYTQIGKTVFYHIYAVTGVGAGVAVGVDTFFTLPVTPLIQTNYTDVVGDGSYWHPATFVYQLSVLTYNSTVFCLRVLGVSSVNVTSYAFDTAGVPNFSVGDEISINGFYQAA